MVLHTALRLASVNSSSIPNPTYLITNSLSPIQSVWMLLQHRSRQRKTGFYQRAIEALPGGTADFEICLSSCANGGGLSQQPDTELRRLL